MATTFIIAFTLHEDSDRTSDRRKIASVLSQMDGVQHLDTIWSVVYAGGSEILHRWLKAGENGFREPDSLMVWPAWPIKQAVGSNMMSS